LVSIFPQCTHLSEKGGGFHPHLTCGQSSLSDFDKLRVEFAKTFTPIEWTVTEVCLISRGADTPFEVKFSVPLNNGANYDEYALASIPVFVPDPVLCETDSSKNMQIVTNRVKKWIHKAQTTDKLPKSRSALGNAITPMCNLSYALTTVDYVYEVLKAEKFFMEIGKEINYLKGPENLKGHVATAVNSKDLRECLQELREWIVRKENNPKSKEALQKCLSYLVMKKVCVDPVEVINHLVELKCIEFHDEYDTVKRSNVEKIIYCA